MEKGKRISESLKLGIYFKAGDAKNENIT